jgi:hypothetical protein
MWRNTLAYLAAPRQRSRRFYAIIALAASALAADTIALWVRSYIIGDYICVGPIYLSFARGYCRVVNAPWFFVPPYPVVGYPWVTYPLDKVGDYPLGSGASYVPLWLLLGIFGLIGGWAVRRLRRSQIAVTRGN